MGPVGVRIRGVNGESHGGLCERRGGVDLLAVDPHPSLAEPVPFPMPIPPRGGLTASGTEPRHGPGLTAQSAVSGHPSPSHQRVVVGAATYTTTEAGANHFPVTRARLQKGL